MGIEKIEKKERTKARDIPQVLDLLRDLLSRERAQESMSDFGKGYGLGTENALTLAIALVGSIGEKEPQVAERTEKNDRSHTSAHQSHGGLDTKCNFELLHTATSPAYCDKPVAFHAWETFPGDSEDRAIWEQWPEYQGGFCTDHLSMADGRFVKLAK